MVVNRLKLVYEQNQDKNLLFLRNLLKEQLQYFLLNFIYNSSYGETFIFKGGTSLRFCFDLPRLSEDLDFDVEKFTAFNFAQFTQEIKRYFQNKLKYEKLQIKISGKNKIIYLQFPILRQIGFPAPERKKSENTLFLRVDLGPVAGKFFQKKISLKPTPDFSLLLRSYALPDLFAGKVSAILKREAFEGKVLKPRFKGRDYFDLFWFLERKVPLNYNYLFSLIGKSSKKEVLKRLKEKVKEAAKRKKELEKDLLPFFPDPAFVKDFSQNFDKLDLSLNF